MRVYRQRGIYYLEITGGQRISLRTKDKKIADSIVVEMESELALINIYKSVFQKAQKILSETETRTSRLLKLIESSRLLGLAEQSNGRRYKSKFENEAQMQVSITHQIETMFELTDIEHCKVSNSGIVDVYAKFRGVPIVIEYKLGEVDEKHLGQCMRYLNDKEISPLMVWLIGESLGKTSDVFNGFDRIKVFTTSKNAKAKNPIKPSINCHPIMELEIIAMETLAETSRLTKASLVV